MNDPRPSRTFATTKTPAAITPKILEACDQVCSGSSPVFVDKIPAAGALINRCAKNVKNYLHGREGEMYFGWDVSVWDKVLVTFVGHVIVKTGDELRCVSPSKYGDSRQLFLPDKTLDFDFSDPNARLRSHHVPILKCPEVVRFIEIVQVEDSIREKYPVTGGSIAMTGADAFELEQVSRERNLLMIRLILSTTEYRDKCPCGSGKKFRKCHQSVLEESLR